MPTDLGAAPGGGIDRRTDHRPPRTNYPDDLDGYTAAHDADLAGATLFVQLLSELPGRKLSDGGLRRVALMFDRATHPS